MTTAEPVKMMEVKRGRGRARLNNKYTFNPAIAKQLDELGITLYSIAEANKDICSYSGLHGVVTGAKEPTLRVSVILAQALGWNVDRLSHILLTNYPIVKVPLSRNNSSHGSNAKTRVHYSEKLITQRLAS